MIPKKLWRNWQMDWSTAWHQRSETQQATTNKCLQMSASDWPSHRNAVPHFKHRNHCSLSLANGLNPRPCPVKTTLKRGLCFRPTLHVVIETTYLFDDLLRAEDKAILWWFRSQSTLSLLHGPSPNIHGLLLLRQGRRSDPQEMSKRSQDANLVHASAQDMNTRTVAPTDPFCPKLVQFIALLLHVCG